MNRRTSALSCVVIALTAGMLNLWSASSVNAQDRPGDDGGPRRERRMREGGEGSGGPGVSGAPGGSGPGGDQRRGDRGGMMRRPIEPTDDEWKQIEAFAAKHSPNRLKVLQRMLGENAPEARFARGFLVGRYRSIEAMKEHDPDLYEVRLEGIELEDRIFGQVEDGAAKPDAPAGKKDALRADMAKWVQMNLKEREQRIERLAESLEDQRKKLEEDKAKRDALVDQKMQDVERDGIRGLLPEGVRRFMDDNPGGGGPRGTGGDRPKPPHDRPPPGGPPTPMP